MSSRTVYKKCISCGIFSNKVPGPKRKVHSLAEAAKLSDFFDTECTIGSFVCKKCYVRYSLEVSQLNKEANLPSTSEAQPESPEFESQESTTTISSLSLPSSGSVVEYASPKEQEDIEYVELPFSRTVSTHKNCFICQKTSGFIVVPFEARKQVFSKMRIFIPKGNRCCPGHLLKKRFYEDEINNFRIVSPTSSIDVKEISKLLECLSVSSDSELTDKIGDYTLSEERLKVFTGLTWEQLIELRHMMPSIRNSESRTVTQALVIFLFRLRTGNSNALISSVLGLDRRQQVSDFSDSVLKAFEQDVLPSRFGIKAFTRQQLIENTSPIVKELHNIEDDELALVCDGTYLRHQKSSNNAYQRKSYSGQKKTPLTKPFTICTTNGFIVDIMGPYTANVNDAQIMEDIMKDSNGLSTLLRENDAFFVDRGFRDVQQFLEERQYRVFMPALKGKRNQLNTEESNGSRLVTIIRWVVEAVHGIMGEKYKMLHYQFDNKMLPKAISYCKIAGFLVNTFGKRCVSKLSTNKDVLSQIRKQSTQENTLATEAETGRWSRRKITFKKLSSREILDFPELTENDLKIFFTGTYQLHQAVSYLAEMMDDSNNINLSYLHETPEMIKVEVRSRHISRKTYHCYIHYRPDSVGYSGILRYFCQCANGMRTIGCCSHVAAVVYYLSYARYQSKILRPAEKLSKYFEETGISPVIEEDSDED